MTNLSKVTSLVTLGFFAIAFTASGQDAPRAMRREARGEQLHVATVADRLHAAHEITADGSILMDESRPKLRKTSEPEDKRMEIHKKGSLKLHDAKQHKEAAGEQHAKHAAKKTKEANVENTDSDQSSADDQQGQTSEAETSADIATAGADSGSTDSSNADSSSTDSSNTDSSSTDSSAADTDSSSTDSSAADTDSSSTESSAAFADADSSPTDNSTDSSSADSGSNSSSEKSEPTDSAEPDTKKDKGKGKGKSKKGKGKAKDKLLFEEPDSAEPDTKEAGAEPASEIQRDSAENGHASKPSTEKLVGEASCSTCWTCEKPDNVFQGKPYWCVCLAKDDWAEPSKKNSGDPFCNKQACLQRLDPRCKKFDNEACVCDASYHWSPNHEHDIPKK
eukprot:TRINITY_DN1656_c0_g3_i3.p1 TRINITY_DN1656_c0_g3~~TRINITY_DN1656_c0_g3_i3.p1  ORF type:complete len:393 (-),score=127.26 TRINITY_DN1656_c0_g3_i3:336-1514(-)